MLARLAGLGEDAKRLAEVAAVGGGRLQLRDAAELAGIDVDSARRRPTRWSAPRSLTAASRCDSRTRWCRARSTRSVPDAERAGLHLRVAELLRAAARRRKATAVHLLSAERGGGEWVVDELELAAGEELSQGSPDGASRFLRRALEEEPPEERVGGCWSILGLAETEAGNPRAPSG